MARLSTGFQPPIMTSLLDAKGVLAYAWEWFFRDVHSRLDPLGIETSFDIVNNQSTPVDIANLKFNSAGVGQAIVEFLVQRVTTGTGATELLESGHFVAVYKPTSDVWVLHLADINAPDNSGVDFTITAAGQVQYTSTNITGTAQISKLFYRVRTMGAKNALYSVAGKN